MNKEIDKDWVYGTNTKLFDLTDSQIEWLADCDPNRLDDIYKQTNVPDGDDESKWNL